jgi:outer membrane PBP1 activator LpoA protein
MIRSMSCQPPMPFRSLSFLRISMPPLRLPTAARIALLSLLLAACAAPAPRPGDGVATDPQGLAAQGLHVESAEAWLRLAELEPERADRARLEAAAQWLAAGREDETRALLELLSQSELERSDEIELILLQAELALADGDGRRAARLLDRLPDGLAGASEARSTELRQRLGAIDPGGPAVVLERLREVVSAPDFRPEDVLPGLIDLPAAELRRLRDDPSVEAELEPWLDLALTARRALLDPVALNRALLDWTARWGLQPAEATDLALWVDTWRAGQAWPDSIAVLLPGQGPLVRAGEVLRDGLLSAWLQLPLQARPALEFMHLDDRPDAAVGARFEAVERGHSMVIGPLPREQVDAVLMLPDGGLPQILLNRPRDEPTGMSSTHAAATLALPPEEEAELAAVHALVEMHQRAVIVAQSSDFGRRVADRFAETFELGGGRIVGRAEYASGEFDHTEQLAVLLEVDRSEQRVEALSRLLGAPVEAIPQRRSDIDLVFLAARGGDGRQLMPQLRFLDLEDLPVYATSDVLSGRDPGRDLDGIRLPIAPWQLTEGPAAERRQQAERLYPDLAGSNSLSLLHALGRDALGLARWLDRMKQDPELYFAGEVGRLRLADGLAFERDLPWAIVRDGRPQPLTED